MRILVIIFVLLNNFIWLIVSIAGLNNYLKGIAPPPTKPTLFYVILAFVFMLMNLLILAYVLQKTNEKTDPKKAGNMKRVFIGLGWFFIIYIVVQFIVGGIVGGIAGSTTSTAAAGAEAGRTASINFFHKYGLYIFLFEVMVVVAGTITKTLPFTNDEK